MRIYFIYAGISCENIMLNFSLTNTRCFFLLSVAVCRQWQRNCLIVMDKRFETACAKQRCLPGRRKPTLRKKPVFIPPSNHSAHKKSRHSGIFYGP